MDFAKYFPIWDKLTPSQQARILDVSHPLKAKAGTVLHNGSMDCLGLLLIRSGQLRVYTLSQEGREVTLYRLFEMDICLFSASCVMPNVQFEVVIEAEKYCDLWVIPSCLFKNFMDESAPVASYINSLITSRFSEVMWLMEQIMWKSFDKRLAGFLLEESQLEGSDTLKLTHEKIANHMGTAREVVTRMLRYFQGEGMVTLTRGTIQITDPKALQSLTE
ncbi:MAG: Crp/Fnr family transcriptional regulator [Ruminococcaceae bacterium]|nr:Crp/Fnr family transcriptional regulator [Oscillospiraceae bacterium]